jgi:hypothetical protein
MRFTGFSLTIAYLQPLHDDELLEALEPDDEEVELALDEELELPLDAALDDDPGLLLDAEPDADALPFDAVADVVGLPSKADSVSVCL